MKTQVNHRSIRSNVGTWLTLLLYPALIVILILLSLL